MKRKGEISITRILGEKVFSIRLEDESSGLQFLSLHISAENLALALGNQGGIECDYELNAPALEYIGKRREHKSVDVKVARGTIFTDEAVKELVAPYCTDGWMALHPENTLGNHHYRTSEGYEVSLVRFV